MSVCTCAHLSLLCMALFFRTTCFSVAAADGQYEAETSDILRILLQLLMSQNLEEPETTIVLHALATCTAHGNPCPHCAVCIPIATTCGRLPAWHLGLPRLILHISTGNIAHLQPKVRKPKERNKEDP